MWPRTYFIFFFFLSSSSSSTSSFSFFCFDSTFDNNQEIVHKMKEKHANNETKTNQRKSIHKIQINMHQIFIWFFWFCFPLTALFCWSSVSVPLRNQVITMKDCTNTCQMKSSKSKKIRRKKKRTQKRNKAYSIGNRTAHNIQHIHAIFIEKVLFICRMNSFFFFFLSFLFSYIIVLINYYY